MSDGASSMACVTLTGGVGSGGGGMLATGGRPMQPLTGPWKKATLFRRLFAAFTSKKWFTTPSDTCNSFPPIARPNLTSSSPTPLPSKKNLYNVRWSMVRWSDGCHQLQQPVASKFVTPSCSVSTSDTEDPAHLNIMSFSSLRDSVRCPLPCRHHENEDLHHSIDHSPPTSRRPATLCTIPTLCEANPIIIAAGSELLDSNRG
ncbi:hypothetical protein EDD36DRAFT_423442 [Exophiala viscosa]|uniref:Uncharacterized protein n=1 Tax=Exophiala viscosa TaxID=2486360 RepID=A0AAN6IAC0_9EURO|nr:hypothetical protein EDD36DRAFT_423442 [Exophiala viscosa]